jgi:CopG family nickel-responsive transcriptional regulator
MLKRFGVSLDEQLLGSFDRLIEREGYTTRSEAIRDLIRDTLIKREWLEGEAESAGVALLLFDHHRLDLSRKLTGRQHEHHDSIIASLHVHLDEQSCLEIVVLKGKAKEIQSIADGLISTKGVLHGHFITASSGKTIL